MPQQAQVNEHHPRIRCVQCRMQRGRMYRGVPAGVILEGTSVVARLIFQHGEGRTTELTEKGLLGRCAPLLIQDRAKRTDSFSVSSVVLPSSPC
jgi:hypothetical protein